MGVFVGSRANSGRALPWQRRLVNWMAVLIIAVLTLTLLDRVEEEAWRAEARAVELMINQLQAQILLVEVESRLRWQESAGSAEGGNPMAWLSQPPANYQGLCGETGPQPGHWCFWQNAAMGQLRYAPRYATESGNKGWAPHFAWQVMREPAEKQNRGRLQLVPVIESPE